MWGNVFSERPQAVKCSNFLGGHFVFLKCWEFCTETIEMPGANTFSGGRAPKTTGFCTVIYGSRGRTSIFHFYFLFFIFHFPISTFEKRGRIG